MRVPLPTIPGPSAAECCAPVAGIDSTLDVDRIAAAAKALAEPVRVQILDVLRRADEPVCQCELIALFEIKQSLLSHHMRSYRGRPGRGRAPHKWAYYSIPPDAFQELTAWLG